MRLLFAHFFLNELFFTMICVFSCENGTISWENKQTKKNMKTRIFRDPHGKSHFGESEGEIPKDM